MKYWKSYSIFSFLLCLFLSACSSMQIFDNVGIKDEIDEELPVVKTFRALPDVTSVGFEWKIPENTTIIDGYIIYRQNKKGEFVKIAFVKNALSTHYYDSKLEPQTDYVYAIASVGKDSKVSKKSAPLHVKTSFIDPVDFVYASQDYAHRIKVFWSPSANPIVKNYIIERQDNNGKFIAIGTTTNRMLVEFFDNNIENGATHTYRITAQSYDGAKSKPSKPVNGKARSAPNVVGGVTASNDKARAIWVEWKQSESKDVVGYNVYASSNPANGYEKIGFVSRESYIDKIDSNGEVRYYKITAIDRYKLESELQQDGVSGQTLAPPQAPSLTKGSIENNRVVLAWEKSNEARIAAYNIYRVSNGVAKKINQTTQTSFTDTIQEGISYIYYVTSVDKNAIESAPSRQVTLSLESQPKAKIK